MNRRDGLQKQEGYVVNFDFIWGIIRSMFWWDM